MEASLKRMYGKAASGVFNCTRVYDHQANKPTIAKLITENVRYGRGTAEDLVKLFRGSGSTSIGEEVQEQLSESTQRLLRAADPKAIVTKESIMQELGIRLSEWVKEGSRLADKNIRDAWSNNRQSLPESTPRACEDAGIY